MSKHLIKASKFMSLVLRHDPAAGNLVLDAEGYVSVFDLLDSLNARGHKISLKELDHIVASDDKQRYSLSQDRTMIRANQGHSVVVDLKLMTVEPPLYLYHGTVAKFIPLIKEGGLKAMSRQYVHLSSNIDTAIQVGSRRGDAIVLTIRSKDLFHTGHMFYLSENNVWLTDHVPSSYIEWSSIA